MSQSETRILADKVFEIVRQENVTLSLDALGMAMTRVLLGVVLVAGKTHREIFEGFMAHTREAGERVMQVLDFPPRS